MDEDAKIERRRQARTRLGAQRDRARQLRRRCVTISLIAFALLWAIVFVQMVSGHDPVLGRGEGGASTVAAKPSASAARASAGGAGPSPPEADAAEAARAAREAAVRVAETEAAEREAAAASAPEPAPVTTAPS